MARCLIALAVLALVIAGCAATPGEHPGPSFQDESRGERPGRNGGMGGGSM